MSGCIDWGIMRDPVMRKRGDNNPDEAKDEGGDGEGMRTAYTIYRSSVGEYWKNDTSGWRWQIQLSQQFGEEMRAQAGGGGRRCGVVLLQNRRPSPLGCMLCVRECRGGAELQLVSEQVNTPRRVIRPNADVACVGLCGMCSPGT
eukprot:GHVU01029671.1.p2 GENE.GHVU01029671.1~~GHVU01029671.1.p2  ORF type:complete len:145 (+),score=8.38 GHVU01029671.1:409-843(+)